MGVQDNVVNKAQKAKDNNNLTTAQDKLLIELSSLKVQSSETNKKVIEYIIEDSVKERLQQKNITYIVEENIAKFVVDGYVFLVDENGNILEIIGAEEENNQRLPKEYQEVEYIESTGEQFIDTGYVATGKTCMKTEYMNTTGTAQYLFMSRIADGNRMYGWNASNEATNYAFRYGSTMAQPSVKSTYNEKHCIEYRLEENKMKAYLDNTYVASIQYYDFTTPTTINLFSYISTNASLKKYTKVRLYSVQFSENGELKRDLVPCYRKADKKAGMYDLVTNAFMGNGGSGNFLMGEKVIY